MSLRKSRSAKRVVLELRALLDFLNRPFLVSRKLLPWAFVGLATPVCIFLALAIPPGLMPDERSHILRADGMLHGQLAGHRQPLGDGSGNFISGLDADPVLAKVVEPIPIEPKFNWSRFASIRSLSWTGTTEFFPYFDNVPVYGPLFYVPAAAVFAISKWIGTSPLTAIFAARLFNAGMFMVLGAFALAIAKRGRTLLFCLLTVPMTLSLASAVGQDGLMIGCSALSAASLTRAERPGEMSTEALGSYALAAVLLACAMMAKPGPYIALAAMLIFPLPPCPKPGLIRGLLLRRAGVAAAAIAPAALWAIYAIHSVATPIPTAPYAAGPLWPSSAAASFSAIDPTAQLKVLLAQPALVVTLPWQFLSHENWWFLWEVIGQITALQLQVPKFAHQIWELAIVAAIGADGLRGASAWRPAVGWPNRGVLLVAAGLCAWAVILAQYLTWTPVGYTMIEGAHGRYMLPIIPLLVVAMPYLTAGDQALWRNASRIIPLLTAASNFFFVPRLILAHL